MEIGAEIWETKSFPEIFWIYVLASSLSGPALSILPSFLITSKKMRSSLDMDPAVLRLCHEHGWNRGVSDGKNFRSERDFDTCRGNRGR